MVWLGITDKPKSDLEEKLLIRGGNKSRLPANQISYFHKMVITVMKVFYKKQEPKIIQYRSYKSFDDYVFQTEFNKILNINLNNADQPAFTEIFQLILDKHAPNPLPSLQKFQ